MSCPFQQPKSDEGYSQEKLNTIRIYKQRGHYDYSTIHSITDSTLVSHVAFNIKDEDGEDTPINLPLTCVLGRYNPDIGYSNLTDRQVDEDNKNSITNGAAEAYLHGNAATMLYKAIKASGDKGVRWMVSFFSLLRTDTRLTAVLHGTARLVPTTDIQKKHWAMRLLTNHMWPDRWESTYPVAQSAMRGVQVIEVKIRTASSKVRASNIGDFEPVVVLGQSLDWQMKDVWSGVVPVYEHFGKPVSSGVMDGVERRDATDDLERIEKVRLNRNEKLKEYSEKAATAGPAEQEMKERVQKWEQTLYTDWAGYDLLRFAKFQIQDNPMNHKMNYLPYLLETFADVMSLTPAQHCLGAYNVDPSSVSISGFSSGGFMTVQLGVAYSDVFNVGFGVFAGGPYDCARNQNAFDKCTFNNLPDIDTPTANMKDWSGNEIADTTNLRDRRIYLQTGSADVTIGPNVMGQLKKQLEIFVDPEKIIYVTTTGAAHTFPTDFNGSGDNPCGTSESPYLSNCEYDGAGAVLKWLYGDLNHRNTGLLSGELLPFDQTGSYGSPGMDQIAYLYVPAPCQGSSTVCRLHVVLHGCTQGYGLIGDKYINSTGYLPWADTNDIILLFPQAAVDSTIHKVWDGTPRNNSLGCWDWIGQYGNNTDQIGGKVSPHDDYLLLSTRLMTLHHLGVQMAAIVNQVKRITSRYQGATTPRVPHSMPSSIINNSTTMFSLSWLMNLFWSPGPEAKVAIIGLDGVGKYTLLQHLSEAEIQIVEWPVMKWPDVKTGKSYRWNMNFVQTYVGYSEKAAHKKWVADQFCDSDGIIFVIDDDKDTRAEAAEWMTCYARGFKPSYGTSYFIKVREGIPWLIMANKKTSDSPSMTVEEIHQTMGLDSLDIDSAKEFN
ncbi:hypothetical protein DPV78_008306 [Talaromyces pinophilus]|nr:hypothetical protein DPV78_008306 [Talaromyces pinophilus]